MKFAAALIATVAANSSSTSSPPSPPLSPPRPEVTVTPLLPRPLPSRTSKRPLPLESSRDLMTDNHSSRSPERWRPSETRWWTTTRWGRQKDEGHRGNAATNQRYGEKTRYHAIRWASSRERHQDPPKGRWRQRNGKEMSMIKHLCFSSNDIVHVIQMLTIWWSSYLWTPQVKRKIPCGQHPLVRCVI